MQVWVLCAGKLKESFYRDAAARLEREIRKRCQLTICEIGDMPIPKNAGEREEARIKMAEGNALLKHIPKDAYVIALCIEGKEINAEGHRRLLSQIQRDGYERLIYVIGGSLGLSDAVTERADYRLSFSKMTFPHQLMRVMLLEAIAADYL